MAIGRERELSELTGRLAHRRPVAVLGEAGVGKTTLVRAAAERIGGRLIEAGALATLSWLPYLPLRRGFGHEFEGDSLYVASVVQAELGDAILFFDDLQWADRPTTALLPVLAGRTPMVVAIRRGDAGTQAALNIATGAGCELLPLTPLAAADAEAVVRELHPQISDAAARRLVERSGGNPFLLEQLAVSGEASDSLRLAVAARLRELTPAGRAALSALALLGRPASEPLLGPGAGEIVAAGLASGEAEISIRHALLAEATMETLEEDERRAIHSRLGTLLDDLGEAARHHAAAGERSLAHEKALEAAARASSTGERVAHLGVAAANAEGAAAEPLRLRAARELIAIAEEGDALALLLELKPADRDRAVEAALLRARGHAALVQLDDARRELGWAEQTGASDPRLQIQLACQKAQLAARDGEYAAAVEAAEAGVSIAAASGLVGEEAADLYATLGATRRYAGVAGALDAQKQALALARQADAGELELSVLERLSFGLLLEGDAHAARESAAGAIERARSLKLLAWERTFAGWHAGFSWHLGEPAAAAAQAEAVLDEAATASTREFLEIYWWQALNDLGRGEEIRDAVEARIATAPLDHDGVGDAIWTLADIHLAAGRPDAAERATDEYLRRFTRASAFVSLVRAWAQFEQGAAPEPRSGKHFPLVEGVPVEIAALELLAGGEPTAAAEGFDRAAALWEGRHVRGAFRCRWAAAESLRRGGDVDGARDRLLALEPELEQRQLHVLLLKARRSLRLAGVPRAAKRTTVGALTGRETEVLALVGNGLTNDEIARRLGVGRPTVVRIVRSAQDKLGATSRAQAAALAAPQ